MNIKGLLGDGFNCPKCGHNKPHAFNVMGQTTCVDCPEGVCTDREAQNPMMQVTVASLGMKLIHEMTKDELISEIVTGACRQMQSWEMDTLRRHVVMTRMMGVKDRLMAEAGTTDDDMGWLF